MKTIKIFILLVSVLFVNSCFSQKPIYTNIHHSLDSIDFFLLYSDIIYSYEDTVTVNLRIVNNSSIPIIIFDYNSLNNTCVKINTTDSTTIINEVYLFGDWKYQLGYENFLYAKTIYSLTEYNYKFHFILKSKISELKYNNSIFSFRGSSHPIIYTLFFNLGYFSSVDIHTIKKDTFETLDIKINEDNSLPDEHLKSVLLGPLWIKQK